MSTIGVRSSATRSAISHVCDNRRSRGHIHTGIYSVQLNQQTVINSQIVSHWGALILYRCVEFYTFPLLYVRVIALGCACARAECVL
jgi:hypothetical protein